MSGTHTVQGSLDSFFAVGTAAKSIRRGRVAKLPVDPHQSMCIALEKNASARVFC